MDLSDSELMHQLVNGNDLALNALMARWADRLVAFLHKMTGDRTAALDLSQETFVKLYQARDRYRLSANFSTWLFTIAANLARNHTRWKARHPTVSIAHSNDEAAVSIAQTADPHPHPAQAAQTAETAHAIHTAFLNLPPELREAMTLFIYEDMGYAEIAAVAGCTKKAVETRIYRARQLMRVDLKHLAS